MSRGFDRSTIGVAVLDTIRRAVAVYKVAAGAIPVGYQKLESAVEQGAFELVGRQHPQTSAKRLGERHLEPRSLALLMLEPANKFTR